jgi:hypothetical protein
MPAERFVLDASAAVEGFLPGGGPGVGTPKAVENMKRAIALQSTFYAA